MSVMVLAFDGYAALVDRLGEDVAGQVGARFARMLAGKMRQEDSLGHFLPGQFAIVSPGTSAAFCAAFAERVRQAVEVARLTVRGESVALTVSIGLAGVRWIGSPPPVPCSIWPPCEPRKPMGAGGNHIVAPGAAPAIPQFHLDPACP